MLSRPARVGSGRDAPADGVNAIRRGRTVTVVVRAAALLGDALLVRLQGPPQMGVSSLDLLLCASPSLHICNARPRLRMEPSNYGVVTQIRPRAPAGRRRPRRSTSPSNWSSFHRIAAPLCSHIAVGVLLPIRNRRRRGRRRILPFHEAARDLHEVAPDVGSIGPARGKCSAGPAAMATSSTSIPPRAVRGRLVPACSSVTSAGRHTRGRNPSHPHALGTSNALDIFPINSDVNLNA